MSPGEITVVIVSYNVRPFLNHCLQSVLRAAAGFQVRVIVVDNASNDGSAEMVRQRYPQVSLIANDENVGFGRANNQAFTQAQGDAVLVLNPDSFVQEDTLSILWSRLHSAPDIGAVGPKILLPDGRFEPRSMRGFPTPWAAFSYLTGLAALFPQSSFFSRYLLTHLHPDHEHEVEALSGCCMLVRRSLIEELHGFDPDYFMYGEDLDLCYRIRQRGYRIIYDPATRIVHFKGESTRRSNIDQEYHFQRAMRLFVQKNLTSRVSTAARSLISLGFFVRSAEKKCLRFLGKIGFPALDVLTLNLLIFTGRQIRLGAPEYDIEVWLINAIYTIFYFISGLYFGIYGDKKYSGKLSLYAAITGGSLAAAFTYFFRQWAFSRFVVLWFGAGMMLTIPVGRILLRNFVRKRPSRTGSSPLQRRALIVGTDARGRKIGEQLLSSTGSEIDPIGFIDFTEDNVGEIISGIPVLGWVGELDRIIAAEQIQELIFSTAEISYERIIELVQSLQDRKLNIRIIPSLESSDSDEITLLRMEISSLPLDKSSSRGIVFKK